MNPGALAIKRFACGCAQVVELHTSTDSQTGNTVLLLEQCETHQIRATIIDRALAGDLVIMESNA